MEPKKVQNYKQRGKVCILKNKSNFLQILCVLCEIALKCASKCQIKSLEIKFFKLYPSHHQMLRYGIWPEKWKRKDAGVGRMTWDCEPRMCKEEIGLLLAPVLMLWGGDHIDHHIGRWVIVHLQIQACLAGLAKKIEYRGTITRPHTLLQNGGHNAPLNFLFIGRIYLSISVSDVMWYYASTGRKKMQIFIKMRARTFLTRL